MKTKMLQKIKKGIWLLAALGWWGVLFPELSLTRDTCRIIWTDTVQTDTDRTEDARAEDGLQEEELSQTEIYYRLLSAEPEQIKIKSRLLEFLAAYFEKNKEK